MSDLKRKGVLEGGQWLKQPTGDCGRPTTGEPKTRAQAEGRDSVPMEPSGQAASGSSIRPQQTSVIRPIASRSSLPPGGGLHACECRHGSTTSLPFSSPVPPLLSQSVLSRWTAGTSSSRPRCTSCSKLTPACLHCPSGKRCFRHRRTLRCSSPSTRLSHWCTTPRPSPRPDSLSLSFRSIRYSCRLDLCWFFLMLLPMMVSG